MTRAVPAAAEPLLRGAAPFALEEEEALRFFDPREVVDSSPSSASESVKSLSSSPSSEMSLATLEARFLRPLLVGFLGAAGEGGGFETREERRTVEVLVVEETEEARAPASEREEVSAWST